MSSLSSDSSDHFIDSTGFLILRLIYTALTMTVVGIAEVGVVTHIAPEAICRYRNFKKDEDNYHDPSPKLEDSVDSITLFVVVICSLCFLIGSMTPTWKGSKGVAEWAYDKIKNFKQWMTGPASSDALDDTPALANENNRDQNPSATSSTTLAVVVSSSVQETVVDDLSGDDKEDGCLPHPQTKLQKYVRYALWGTYAATAGASIVKNISGVVSTLVDLLGMNEHHARHMAYACSFFMFANSQSAGLPSFKENLTHDLSKYFSPRIPNNYLGFLYALVKAMNSYYWAEVFLHDEVGPEVDHWFPLKLIFAVGTGVTTVVTMGKSVHKIGEIIKKAFDGHVPESVLFALSALVWMAINSYPIDNVISRMISPNENAHLSPSNSLVDLCETEMLNRHGSHASQIGIFATSAVLGISFSTVFTVFQLSKYERPALLQKLFDLCGCGSTLTDAKTEDSSDTGEESALLTIVTPGATSYGTASQEQSAGKTWVTVTRERPADRRVHTLYCSVRAAVGGLFSAGPASEHASDGEEEMQLTSGNADINGGDGYVPEEGRRSLYSTL